MPSRLAGSIRLSKDTGSLPDDVIYDIMVQRVLIDTSVLRAGVVSSAGASRVLLLAALEGEVRAMASTALMLQYEDGLLRPETLERAGLSARDALDLLDDFCAVCHPVAVDVRWRPQSPDAGDDLVIEAAVNGVADVIATYNLRDLPAPAARFGIAAEVPADVLRRILR
jgi:predicted nucleic acid-binding protein